jgi:hypothetical protein
MLSIIFNLVEKATITSLYIDYMQLIYSISIIYI